MIWDDTGFLLSKNRYSENSLIAEIFTENHGKIPGIIFGGTSKKIKNYLQIGNKIHVNFNSKSENRIGYFKIEIQEALTPLFFDNKKKLSCIINAMNLIKLLTRLASQYQMDLTNSNRVQMDSFDSKNLFKGLIDAAFDLAQKGFVVKHGNAKKSC